MKVLHFTNRFLGGGAENIFLTAKFLKEKCNAVLIVHGLEFDEGLVKKAQKLGINCKAFPLKQFSFFSYLKTLFLLFSFLRKEKFDVVHTHSTEGGFVGRLAAFLAGTPKIIHTFHGAPFEKRGFLLRQALLFLERTLAPITDVLVVNSESMISYYVSKGIGKRKDFTIVTSGVDFKKIQNTKPLKLEGKTKAALVSRLDEGKGIEDVINAFQGINAFLYIVGDGPLKEKLEQSKPDNVVFLGHVSDVGSVLKAVDLFILCSYREGTPRAITEAMYAGLPIVASNIGGIPDQVKHGENGFLVKPGAIKEIRNAVNKILSNPDLKKKMSQASEKKAKLFSLKKMHQDLQSLYF